MDDSRFVEYVEVTSEGIMIIPQRVLEALELSIGDTVVFTVEDNVVYMENTKQRVKAIESLFGCIPADITEDEAREERLMSSAKINEYLAEAAQIKKLVETGKCPVFDDVDTLFNMLNSSEQANQKESEKEDGVN